MTKLLVSVRDVAEARIALEAGVDLLDLKEPIRGPLGAVSPTTINQVIEVVAGRVPISAALGELADLVDAPSPSPAVSRALRYVKLGLSRCTARPDWPAQWRRILQSLAPQAAAVAVIYADGAGVWAPGVDEILEAATLVGCQAVLVDTAIKNGRSLLDHWSQDTLENFLADARRRGLTTVVGGGLTLGTIPVVAECRPDYVAIRGAACRGDRAGTIDATCLAAVRDALMNAHPRRLAGG